MSFIIAAPTNFALDPSIAYYVYFRPIQPQDIIVYTQLIIDESNAPFESSYGGIVGAGHVLTLCLDHVLAEEIQRAMPKRVLMIALHDWISRFPQPLIPITEEPEISVEEEKVKEKVELTEEESKQILEEEYEKYMSD